MSDKNTQLMDSHGIPREARATTLPNIGAHLLRSWVMEEKGDRKVLALAPWMTGLHNRSDLAFWLVAKEAALAKQHLLVCDYVDLRDGIVSDHDREDLESVYVGMDMASMICIRHFAEAEVDPIKTAYDRARVVSWMERQIRSGTRFVLYPLTIASLIDAPGPWPDSFTYFMREAAAAYFVTENGVIVQ